MEDKTFSEEAKIYNEVINKNLNEELDQLDHSILFRDNIKALNSIVYQVNCSKGFWNGQFNPAEKIVLIHSEASELLEEFREKEPSMNNIATELADIIIRCLDLSEHMGVDIGDAILKKVRKNISRPQKHGKKF